MLSAAGLPLSPNLAPRNFEILSGASTKHLQLTLDNRFSFSLCGSGSVLLDLPRRVLSVLCRCISGGLLLLVQELSSKAVLTASELRVGQSSSMHISKSWAPIALSVRTSTDHDVQMWI